MTYTNQASLTKHYGERMLVQLTDRADPPTELVDADVVEAACIDADALIDGYLAQRYVLPVNPVPKLLSAVARKLAIYTLHTFSPDPKIEDEYKGALITLKMIGDGKVRLPSEGIEPATTGSGGVMTTDRERPMTQNNLKGFI